LLRCFVMAALTSPFKSKIRLDAENAALRHQVIVLRRKLRGRVRLTVHDRWFFVQLYRWFPSILTVITIVQPETPVRWHRGGLSQLSYCRHAAMLVEVDRRLTYAAGSRRRVARRTEPG
jgi:hypothetical protein